MKIKSLPSMITLAFIAMSSSALAADSLDDELSEFSGEYVLTAGDEECAQQLSIGTYDTDSGVDRFFATVTKDLSFEVRVTTVNTGDFETQLHTVSPRAKVSLDGTLNVSIRGTRYCYADVVAFPCGRYRTDAEYTRVPGGIQLTIEQGLFGRRSDCTYAQSTL